MARFRATIKGNRGMASRLGHSSGIVSNTNAHRVGVHVAGYVDSLGDDAFVVSATSGSYGNGTTRTLGIVKMGPNGNPIFTPTRDVAVDAAATIRAAATDTCACGKVKVCPDFHRGDIRAAGGGK